MSLRRSLLGELPPCTMRPLAEVQDANQPRGVGAGPSGDSLCHPLPPFVCMQPDTQEDGHRNCSQMQDIILLHG